MNDLNAKYPKLSLFIESLNLISFLTMLHVFLGARLRFDSVIPIR
jgi:hypothetical protein